MSATIAVPMSALIPMPKLVTMLVLLSIPMFLTCRRMVVNLLLQGVEVRVVVGCWGAGGWRNREEQQMVSGVPGCGGAYFCRG